MSRFTFMDDAYPHMHQALADCPTALVAQQLSLAINDFLVESQCYQIDLDPISIRADRADYELYGTPENTVIHRVVKVTRDEYVMNPQAEFEVVNKTTLRLVPTPTVAASQALDVRVALRLEDDATWIEDSEEWQRIWTDWRRGFIARALFLLQAMPNKRWSSEGQAALNLAEYYRILGNCMREQRKNATRRALTAHARHRWTL